MVQQTLCATDIERGHRCVTEHGVLSKAGARHLPMIVLTTLYHPDGNRWIVISLFVVTMTMVGMFFACLRLTTVSVWPPSIGHSVHTVLSAVISAFTTASSSLTTEYQAGDSGILLTLGYAALAGWLMSSLTKDPRRELASALELSIRTVG